MQSKTDDWLDAVHQAFDNRYPAGIKDTMSQQLYLLSDNGCQPTSQRLMKESATLGIKQIFTTRSNPKGNSDTKRALRTLKEDLCLTL